MASCECCWNDYRGREVSGVKVTYDEVKAHHEDRACICTQGDHLIEARKARAGQFWDEERQMDRREDAEVGE